MCRSRFLVSGTVQGVGFRPFICRLAEEFDLKGTVQNTGEGVIIEIAGSPEKIKGFKRKIKSSAPPAAKVRDLKELEAAGTDFNNFTIIESSGIPSSSLNIPPDIAVCSECLNDIESPSGRRYGYPFTSCLNCGPRLSIIKDLPYDRASVTMDDFIMCSACRREYDNIKDRRYHAQPIACPECGPQYSFKYKKCAGAVKAAAAALASGEVIALKGWGGYHLLADAENAAAVKNLRKLKKREHKPLALMADTAGSIKKYCRLSPGEKKILESCRRPIVLLTKKRSGSIPDLIAPLNNSIGFMLPYSPVHYLLFKYSGLKIIVATSLNRSGEPTAVNRKGPDSAFSSVPGLEHNLKISMRSDDSVIKYVSGENIILRRSRGYVPEEIPLPGRLECLASGAERNSSFCYSRKGKAMPSQYTGNLGELNSVAEYEKIIEKFRDIWGFNPELLGCDMHPGYGSTRVFGNLSKNWGIELKKIQHHHAHLAGCAAENGLRGNFIGVAFDGTGYGPGGELMGGEFLEFNYRDYSRRGYLKAVRQPGGNAAAREPWRMAVSYMKDAGVSIEKTRLKIPAEKLSALEIMLDKDINSPHTSSAGRLFDAVAAITGIVSENTYISRAPVALESLVRKRYLDNGYNFDIIEREETFSVDTGDIIRGISGDISKNGDIKKIVSKFHYTIASAAVAGLLKLRDMTGLTQACLSGGVFCNSYLAPLVKELAEGSGIKIYTHKLVSPNDNGLSYGQAAVLSGGSE